ncbi:IS3 family transposase [Cytobacillus horneckiae]
MITTKLGSTQTRNLFHCYNNLRIKLKLIGLSPVQSRTQFKGR